MIATEESIFEENQVEELLSSLEETYGEIPPLYSKLAENSPQLLLGYDKLEKSLNNKLFDSIETQIIMLSFSKKNEATVCQSFHHQLLCLHGLEDKDIELIKNGNSLENFKHQTLVEFCNDLHENKGKLNKETLKRFLEAGYTTEHIFRIVHFLSIKVVTNFASNIISTLELE